MKLIFNGKQIGPVAKELGVPSSTVRFWADTFTKHVHPERNTKGNRVFSDKDIAALKKIKFYSDKGYSLEAIETKLLSEHSDLEEKLMEVRRGLQEILDAYENS